MGTAAKIRELQIGLGFAKQADIATPSAATGIARFNKLNADTVNPKLNTENDATEIGKGHEFATQVFPTSWDVGPFNIEKYLGSQFAAIIAAFCLGNVVKSGTAPNITYTCTPIDPTTATNGLELPYLTFVEQMRPGANKVIDRAYPGVAVEEFTISVNAGPGRANSKLTASLVGSGKFITPSTITLPAGISDVLLPSASLTFTALTTDYVAGKTILSVEFGWKNNLDTNAGFYPGSGFQTTGDATTGAIRGKLEVGDRVPKLKFVARFTKDSDELAKLQAGTTGPVTIGLSSGANHSILATFWKCAFEVATLGTSGNIVTVEVTCTPEYDATNGVLTVVVKTNLDAICQ